MSKNRCGACPTCIRLNRLHRLTEGRGINVEMMKSLAIAESAPCLKDLGVAHKAVGPAMAQTPTPVGLPPLTPKLKVKRTMKAVLGHRKLRMYDIRVMVRF